MIHAQAFKTFVVTPPAAIVDNASFTTTEIDTLGFDYVSIQVILGATDVDMTALKVQESDTSGSGHADITGLVSSGTTGNGRLPQDDDENKIFVFDIDMRGRKRYLDVVATAGNGSSGTYGTIIAHLSRAKEVPYDATTRGAASVLRV